MPYPPPKSQYFLLLKVKFAQTDFEAHRPSKSVVYGIRTIFLFISLILLSGFLYFVLRAHGNHTSGLPAEKVISCYYNFPDYSNYEQLMPCEIRPRMCTHINVAFAQIVNKEIYLNHNQERAIKDLLELKNENPDLKILISIGGAGNNNGFSDMVKDHASRKTFIKSVKTVLKNLTLDGIDLDWEFPAVHNANSFEEKKRERQHFSQLLREIRAEYVREKHNYLLTIAAAAPKSIVDTAYDIDQINLYTDFVNIMTYDFHFYTKYTPFTGLNSPIYARSEEKLYLSTLNINYTCNMYLEKGLDRNKIVVGIPTFGHSFKLVNSENANIGSPASGYGSIGNNGFVNFPDVCRYFTKHEDFHYKMDNDSEVPYIYRSNEWVSFDNPESVELKALYIKENHFRGAMIYSLNSDDYAGYCFPGDGDTSPFPLTLQVRGALLFSDDLPE